MGNGTGFTRRAFLRTVAATGSAALATPTIVRAGFAAETLRVRIAGGYGDTWDKVFFQPFFEKTGVRVEGVLSKDHPLSLFKAASETGVFQWDMASGIVKDLEKTAREAGYLTTLNLPAEAVAGWAAETYSDTWVAAASGTWGLVYRSDGVRREMASFKDMWNVEDFPGRRSLRARVHEAVEMSLRGVGVAPAEVYNLLSTEAGWNEAFAALDKIKPHIAFWWDSDSQADQAIASGDLDICPIMAHRAMQLSKGGTPLAIQYNEGYYVYQGWTIPANSPKLDIAREFIAFAIAPERQAGFSQSTFLSPISKEAFDFLPADFVASLPTSPDNFAKQTEQNWEFWAKNQSYAVERFNKWRLS